MRGKLLCMAGGSWGFFGCFCVSRSTDQVFCSRVLPFRVHFLLFLPASSDCASLCHLMIRKECCKEAIGFSNAHQSLICVSCIAPNQA